MALYGVLRPNLAAKANKFRAIQVVCQPGGKPGHFLKGITRGNERIQKTLFPGMREKDKCHCNL